MNEPKPETAAEILAPAGNGGEGSANEMQLPPARTLGREDQARLEKMLREASAIQGRRSSLLQREQELTTKVGLAKGRLLLKPEMEAALEALQQMAHERSLGAFERMLTAIVRDVQPGTPTQIHLELSTERNMPALDIFAVVGGEREDITSGAVANIVSTGLRFITLARSGRAPFILLDEPDCFIEGGDVQNFFNVIDQLSRDAGIQTLIITHHDVSSFADRFRTYDVTEVDSNDNWPRRMPELLSEGDMTPNPLRDTHFTFIEAENVESFTRGRIELSPGVTAITGKNGRGKSAWARMLRAAFLGESNDALVRHGKTGCSIAIGISDGRVLVHNRKTKGAVKGEYIMHSPESYEYAEANPNWRKDDGAPPTLHHSEGVRLPEWVTAETMVGPVDGINVALWPQLTPVFMLDQPASKRASLLSIGRESGHLYAMNDLYKDDLRTDTLSVREGEKEIGAIRAVTGGLEKIDEVVLQIESAQATLEALLAQQDLLQEAQDLLAALRKQQEELAVIERWMATARQLGEPPEVQRTEGLEAWLERVKAATDAIALRTDAHVPAEPTLAGADEVAALLSGMRDATQAAALAGRIPTDPVAPKVLDTSSAQQLLTAMEQAASDSELPRLAQIELPALEVTQECADLLAGMALAQRDSEIRRLVQPAAAQMVETNELGALLEEMGRATSLVNSCRAQAETLLGESRELDALIDRATEVLGAEWSLPHGRVTRLVEQIVQTTHGSGEQKRIVCQLEHLERQIVNVAKEGFSFGLAEGLARATAPGIEKPEAAHVAPLRRAA